MTEGANSAHDPRGPAPLGHTCVLGTVLGTVLGAVLGAVPGGPGLAGSAAQRHLASGAEPAAGSAGAVLPGAAALGRPLSLARGPPFPPPLLATPSQGSGPVTFLNSSFSHFVPGAGHLPFHT